MTQVFKRKRFVELVSEGKHTQAEIASLLDVNRSTINRVIKRANSESGLDHKKGAERPAVKRQKIKLSCSHYVNKDAQKPLKSIENVLKQ